MKTKSHVAVCCGLILLATAGCKPIVTENVVGLSDSNETTSVQAKQADESRILSVGSKAPDFEVEALGGETIKLSDYVAASSGPTILLFDRAHW